MGMFDSLRVPCQCGSSAEFQSKAGERTLAEYTIEDCPAPVAADLIHTTETCDGCGRPVTLRGAVVLMAEWG